VSRPSGRTLAHELSNQLGIVVSYAELLLEELGADNPNVPAVERIDRAARRLMRLFEGVTSFEDVGEDVRLQCTDHLAAIRQSAESVLNRAAATDPLAADIREVIKAAAAVAAIVKPA
jgi:signal transduction histidine kinase